VQAERAAARALARAQRAAQLEVEKQRRHERDYGEGGHVVVTTTCSSVTLAFTRFPATGHQLHGVITIRTPARESIREPLNVSFSGSETTKVVPLQVYRGRYLIDVLAQWKGGQFDIGSIVDCGPTPEFTIEKLERLGDAGEYVKGPLTGHVGETVDYGILLRNTGNTSLTFSSLSDPNCDPGTITGGPEGPVPVGGSAKFICAHLLTDADLQAGSYANVASITGTPPDGEGQAREKRSETVVVALTPTPPQSGAIQPSAPSSPGVGTGSATGSGNAVADKQLLAAGLGSSTGPGGGVLAFVQTTPPSLRGAQGCVRNTFKASLRAKGVSAVSFYLDGHRLRTLSARSARRGLLSISIDSSRLKVGAHRLVAKIVMAKVASAAKQVRASRTLTFVRCASAAVRPKFTG